MANGSQYKEKTFLFYAYIFHMEFATCRGQIHKCIVYLDKMIYFETGGLVWWIVTSQDLSITGETMA